MGEIVEKMTHSYERADQYENEVFVRVYEDINKGKITKIEVITFLPNIIPAEKISKHVAVYQPKMKEFETALEKEILYLEKFENCQKSLETSLTQIKVLPKNKTLKKELQQAIQELKKYEKVISLLRKELKELQNKKNK